MTEEKRFSRYDASQDLRDCPEWTMRTYNCCGLNFQYREQKGSQCGFAFLNTGTNRSKLLALAEVHVILIPDCNGVYLPVAVVSRKG